MIFLQSDGTVLIDTKINTDGAKTGSEDIKRTLSGTMDYIKLLPQAFKDIPGIMKHTFSSASKSIQSLSPSVRNLQDEWTGIRTHCIMQKRLVMDLEMRHMTRH